MYHKPLAYGIRAPELKKIAAKNDDLEVRDVKDIFDKILNETVKRSTKDLRKWINSKVPKMTGRLRRDLLNHLRTSYVSSTVLRVYIQTSVEYAKRVNDFETFNVRHRGKRVKYRGKTIILHDFKAIGHFFDKMVPFAIKTILYHLERAKRKYASRTKMKYNEMKVIKLW
jgi:hypothetical protein